MRGKNYARVDFTQTYRSDTYKDRAKKELLMEKIDGEWLIVQEQLMEYKGNIKQKEEPILIETIDNEDTAHEQAIEAAINQWADAWSNQNIDGYLARYAKEFIPSKGLSKKTWEKRRTERLLVPSFIEITLSNINIHMRGNNYAKVDFTQTYKSDTYKDRAKKELLMEKIDGEWLIIKEK